MLGGDLDTGGITEKWLETILAKSHEAYSPSAEGTQDLVSSSHTCEKGATPVVQGGKLKPRKVKQAVKGHSVKY